MTSRCEFKSPLLDHRKAVKLACPITFQTEVIPSGYRSKMCAADALVNVLPTKESLGGLVN